MTDTYKPIRKIEDLKPYRRLQPRPIAKPGTALVLHREGESLRVVWPTATEARTESGTESRWASKYDTAYEVDVGLHWLTWPLNVPSQAEPLGFQVNLWFACTIVEPDTIVSRKFEDARQVIEPFVLQKIKAASRTCNVERSAEAEKAITDSLQSSILWEGFKLDGFIVNVSPDPAAREHMQKQEQEREDDKRRDKEAHRQAAEKVEGRKELRSNVTFYADLLKDPDASMWSVLLAQDPATLPKLVERHNAQIDARQNLLTDMLQKFMVRDDIEPYQREQGLRLLWDRLMSEFQDSTRSFPSRIPPAMPSGPTPDPKGPDEPENGQRRDEP